MSATVLYTPEVLGLAIELAAYPLTDDLPLVAEARSRSCGSSIVLGLALDRMGRVTRLGLQSHACAIGQASAAIFAAHAIGRDGESLVATREAVVRWLAEQGPMPEVSRFDAIGAAQSYPARHGAVLLPWDAALSALGGK